mgnify:CR=1 FL=1|tara:strand:- start:5592 stop:5813 length:222 start_codon:yes stop_codon:yes gene_type:complete
MSRQIAMSFTFNPQGVGMQSSSVRNTNLQQNNLVNFRARLQQNVQQNVQQNNQQQLKNMNIPKSKGSGCGCGK